MPKTENAEPKRTKDRSERVDPIEMKSRTLKVEPSRAVP
jgi:hypothetical protein